MASDRPLARRLAYTAARRSMAEMEVILDRFLRARLDDLDDAACERLLTLLGLPDADLYDWLGGIQAVPDTVDREALSWLQPFRRADGASPG